MTEQQIKEELARYCPEGSYTLSHYDGTTGVIYTLEGPFGQFTTTSLDMLWGYARAIIDSMFL